MTLFMHSFGFTVSILEETKNLKSKLSLNEYIIAQFTNFGKK